MNRKPQQRNGFSILEMMTAMTIFSVMGFSLFGMFSALTTMQTTSLGIQHFKNEGYMVLERLEKELSGALVSTNSLAENLTGIRKNYTAEFICTNTAGNPLSFPGKAPLVASDTAQNNAQQLYFTRQNESLIDASNPTASITGMLQNNQSNKVLWSSSRLVEHIVYLTTTQTLQIFSRDETLDATNRVTGVARIAEDGGNHVVPGKPWASGVANIEYLFWGNSNLSWTRYVDALGATINQPLRTWDSRVAVNNIHEENQLPRGMKILLTMGYNPERDHRRAIDLTTGKTQWVVFEKVLMFERL